MQKLKITPYQNSISIIMTKMFTLQIQNNITNWNNQNIDNTENIRNYLIFLLESIAVINI
jgi:hypothetical protein